MEIKITKRQLLWHQHNDMCCNWYYGVYGRIYNDTKTRYRKFRFVVHYDYDDIAEWFEPENDVCPSITKEMHKEYLEELIFCCFTYLIKSYDDCKDFYQACNDSITHYNKCAA